MKGFLQISAVLLCCFVLIANGDRKGKSEDDTSDSTEVQGGSKGSKRIPERDGQCSCRALENQVEQLEFRLDRMIDLWNDFVDKNRDPYGQGPGQYSNQYPGMRNPPQGSGSYPPSDGRYPPRRPGYGGRRDMDNERGSSPRQFRF